MRPVETVGQQPFYGLTLFSFSQGPLFGAALPSPLQCHHMVDVDCRGVLSLESEWNPAMGDSLRNKLDANRSDGLLNIG